MRRRVDLPLSAYGSSSASSAPQIVKHRLSWSEAQEWVTGSPKARANIRAAALQTCHSLGVVRGYYKIRLPNDDNFSTLEEGTIRDLDELVTATSLSP